MRVMYDMSFPLARYITDQKKEKLIRKRKERFAWAEEKASIIRKKGILEILKKIPSLKERIISTMESRLKISFPRRHSKTV